MIENVEKYCRELFVNDLPELCCFHNLKHTISVLKGVEVICDSENIQLDEREKLLVAAWFHDLGFIHAYKGHESKSMELASEFLAKNGCAEDYISTINALIAATRIPQKPTDQLEKIICDADLFHLADPSYWKRNSLLKKELSQCLKVNMSEEKWLTNNLKFLKNHTYFTEYGREVLEPMKQAHIKENIDILEKIAT